MGAVADIGDHVIGQQLHGGLGQLCDQDGDGVARPALVGDDRPATQPWLRTRGSPRREWLTATATAWRRAHNRAALSSDGSTSPGQLSRSAAANPRRPRVCRGDWKPLRRSCSEIPLLIFDGRRSLRALRWCSWHR